MRNLARGEIIQNPSAPMCLMARVGDSRHIGACCALLEQFRFVYDDMTWQALPGMFQTLISAGAMQLCLVENRGVLDTPSLIAFCGSIFVTDRFCREARTKLPPYLGLQIARRFSKSKLPVLDRNQVAFANSKTGVTVMTRLLRNAMRFSLL